MDEERLFEARLLWTKISNSPNFNWIVDRVKLFAGKKQKCQHSLRFVIYLEDSRRQT